MVLTFLDKKKENNKATKMQRNINQVLCVFASFTNTSLWERLKYIYAVLLLFIFTYPLYSQTPRETRAVWVSTNFRLDWPPPTYNEETQKKELEKIFDDIERKNLNTIYFQVRSNGTVLFRSSMELFSPYITGSIGDFGNYDPLEFAITEAHKRGLEIHAWVNINRIFSGNNISIKNNPLHISQINPEWVYEKADNSIWLDPGIPEVREYLVELINEIVQNYYVDGIQLDFIRYPKAPIDDIKSYNTYGEGIPKPQWRRDNITKFISSLNKRIKQTKPKIKLGVTPIGIYKSITNGRGMEGYSDVFQDTREWLRLGIIDYAVPQIYWDMKSNPKFDALAKDWINNSFGKNIIIGIGAYKTEVYNEIEREINITRTLNASGVAFFRYKSIAQKRFYSFAEKTLPTAMPWIEDTLELANLKLSSNYKNGKALLNFQIDNKSHTSKGYFTLYESYSLQDSSNSKLIKVIPNYISEMSFLIPQPNRINYYYSATQFDPLWNASSNRSTATIISIPKLKKIEKSIDPFENPILLQDGDKSSILIYSNMEEEITLFKSSIKNKSSMISKHFLKRGINQITLNFDLSIYEKIVIDFLKGKRSVSLGISSSN
ncbi:MAG: family 10 glycosylhydrolase [Melioribacteraceae bacterium]|nr:family 10 glycosylhydrolase [Melioribacteraceae bacterium]